jgi:DNA relaxase NicK
LAEERGPEAGVVRALVDWYAGTTGSSDVEAVKVTLGLGSGSGAEWVPLKRGRMGYRKVERCGHLEIWYDGTPEMGTHVCASGEGCRELEAREGFTWPDFMRRMREGGIQATRIDIAVDDGRRQITFRQMFEAWDEKRMIGRWREVHADLGGSCKGGRDGGEKLTLGRRSSEVYGRIYDKGKQIGAESFLRWELEIKGKSAQALALYIEADRPIGELVASVLGARLRVVELGRAKQRERWSTAQWWLDFIGAVEAVKLSAGKVAKTLSEIHAWFVRQVAPMLSVLAEVAGDWEFIAEAIEQGRRRWGPSHRLLVASAAAGAGGRCVG